MNDHVIIFTHIWPEIIFVSRLSNHCTLALCCTDMSTVYKTKAEIHVICATHYYKFMKKTIRIYFLFCMIYAVLLFSILSERNILSPDVCSDK